MTEPINLTQLREDVDRDSDFLNSGSSPLNHATALALIYTAEAAIAYQAEMLEDTKTRRISQAEVNFHASLTHYTTTP